jgi:hypothetical protein
MTGLSPSLLQQLQRTLLNCGPFNNSRELRAIFIDNRIAPWQHDLPDANTPSKRVMATIDHLIRRSTKEENALVLFLQVLADQFSQNDSCYPTLKDLASILAEEIEETTVPKASFGELSIEEFPLDKRPFQAGVEEIQERLKALHTRYGQQCQPVPLRELCGALGELFMRNTFCESPLICHSELWSVRFCAALETLDVITAYRTYLSRHQNDYSSHTVLEIIQVLSNLIPALRRYCHALTNFFTPPAELLEARYELRNGHYLQLKAKLDKISLPSEDIAPEVMSLSESHFKYIKTTVEGFSPFLVHCPEV